MTPMKTRFNFKQVFLFFLPVGYIFLVWFIFASPYFLKGLVPFPSTYQVNHFPPWSSYEKFWRPVKNGAMPDIIDQIYPWKRFTIDTIKQGQLPLWNPNNFAGNPHLANFQTAVFSPFNLLFFLLPFIDAWSVMILLQPLFAGLFTYFFLRELSASKVGCVVGSITYMFSGFMVVWMAYGTLSMTMAFLPLLLYAIEKSFQRKTIPFLLIISIATAFSFLSGHFQTGLYVFLFSCVYFLFKSFTRKNIKTSLIVGFFIFLGVGISLVQLLPSIKFYQHAVRSNIFIQRGGGIPLHYLVTIFAPDFFGNPVTRNNWFGYYAEWASFIGIVPLIFSVIAIFKKERTVPLFFFIGGIVALVLSLDTSLLTLLGNLRIPVLSTSTPSRIIVLFSFSFSVLAGIGFDVFQQALEKRKRKKIFLTILAVTSVLLLGWFMIYILELVPVKNRIIAQKNMILPTILVFNVIILTCCSFIFNRKKFTRLALLILLVFVTVDSIRFAQKWMPFDPREFVFPDLPVISAMKKNIGTGRIFGNIGAQVSTFYQIPSVEGYDPLYIQRYGEFMRTSLNGTFQQAERSAVRIGRSGVYLDRVLDLLAVKLIFHPRADTGASWAYSVWKDPQRFSVVYEDNKFQLFKNNTALNRVQVFTNYEVISDGKKLLKRFFEEDFDFRNTLLLEENPKLGKNKKRQSDVSVTSYTPNKILISVSSNQPALLFLSDNYFPGWKATVNGKEVKIYRANYTFRAVVIPAGHATVEFSYTNLL